MQIILHDLLLPKTLTKVDMEQVTLQKTIT